jgi:hypothetical protein
VCTNEFSAPCRLVPAIRYVRARTVRQSCFNFPSQVSVTLHRFWYRFHAQHVPRFRRVPSPPVDFGFQRIRLLCARSILYNVTFNSMEYRCSSSTRKHIGLVACWIEKYHPHPPVRFIKRTRAGFGPSPLEIKLHELVNNYNIKAIGSSVFISRCRPKPDKITRT